jgi:hypothetical protein
MQARSNRAQYRQWIQAAPLEWRLWSFIVARAIHEKKSLYECCLDTCVLFSLYHGCPDSAKVHSGVGHPFYFRWKAILFLVSIIRYLRQVVHEITPFLSRYYLILSKNKQLEYHPFTEKTSKDVRLWKIFSDFWRFLYFNSWDWRLWRIRPVWFPQTIHTFNISAGGIWPTHSIPNTLGLGCICT